MRTSAAGTPIALPDPVDLGARGFRRISVALFAAGMATYNLLYATQALLPQLVAAFAITPSQASLTGRLLSGLVSDVAGWRVGMLADALLAVVCTGLIVWLLPRSCRFVAQPLRLRPLLGGMGAAFADPALAVHDGADTLVLVLPGLLLLTGGFLAAHSTASGWVAARAGGQARAQASGLYLLACYGGSSIGGWLAGPAFTASGWGGLTVAVLGAPGVALLACSRAAHR